MSVTPTFQGEVQFRRYSDSSTQGPGVYFGLAEREALEAFIGKEGKRFMAVLVEIGDDEQPVQRKDTRGPLCREACDLCELPAFQRFAAGVNYWPKGDSLNAEQCKSYILQACAVASRKELDADSLKGAMFIERIRQPFMRWQREQKR
jgi:hypothetical protein